MKSSTQSSMPRAERVLPALRYRGNHSRFRREVTHALGEGKGPVDTLAPARHKVLLLGVALVSTYGLLISTILTGPWLALVVALFQVLCLITALGIAHDASHGALSRRAWVNHLGTAVFDLVGVNGYVWHFDHVIAHHNTPNVSRYDANLYGWGPIRLDPHSPRQPWHRFQHLYAPFVYALASLFKVYIGDFVAFGRNRAEAYLPLQHSFRALIRLVVFKAWAVCFTLLLPMWVTGDLEGVLAGYVIGHLCGGLLMGAIFQPTHTNELVAWPKPNTAGEVATSFEEHVLTTIADYATDNAWITWLTGGLNIHAIHHLFPKLAHLYLREAAQVVQDLAPRHGLHYYVFPTWWSAIQSHFRALHALGRVGPEGVSPSGQVFAIMPQRQAGSARQHMPDGAGTHNILSRDTSPGASGMSAAKFRILPNIWRRS